jgi:hypothetical protein
VWHKEANVSLTLSTSLVSSVVAFILSFLVERVPGFAERWAASNYKALIVAGAGLVVTVALVGLGYAGAPIGDLPRPFIWDGLFASVNVFVAFLVSSQTAYALQSSKLPRNME